MSPSGSRPPIFVIGFQRSGTTLLQSLLGAHPAIAAPPELHFWFRVELLAATWGDLGDDAVLRRVVQEALHPPVPLLDGAGFDVDRVVARAASGPRTYAGVLDAIMWDFAERHGAVRWSEKSPGQPPDVALRWFPDAQLVHIVRDPRDTVASNVATPWGERQPWVLARRWRRFTLRAMHVGNRVGPSQYLRIRYEDLCDDPDAVMRLVFSHLREDFDPAILDDPARREAALAPVAAPHQRLEQPITPGARGGSRLQRARVAATTHDLLPGLGYPAASSRAIAVGRLANAVTVPTAWRAARWRWRARRAARDPDRLPAVLGDFQQQAGRGT